MASRETQARIEEDAREATRHDFEGTPLVLVNGRKGSSFGPWLKAVPSESSPVWSLSRILCKRLIA